MITMVLLGDFIFSWLFSHYWLEFFPEEELPFFPIYLFIQLVIAVWTLGVYFLGYNRKLSLFCCSDYSAWSLGTLFGDGLGRPHIPDPFWALPYFLAPQDFSGSSSIFPTSDSGIGQFFHWRLDGIAIFTVFQNEDLGGWWAHSSRGSRLRGPLSAELGTCGVDGLCPFICTRIASHERPSVPLTPTSNWGLLLVLFPAAELVTYFMWETGPFCLFSPRARMATTALHTAEHTHQLECGTCAWFWICFSQSQSCQS